MNRAIAFLREKLQYMIDQKCPIEKLIITKSLRSDYKNPQQIAHKVLADRMGVRDTGNKPNTGDRIPYAYIHNTTKGALQGDRIEHPDYIKQQRLPELFILYNEPDHETGSAIICVGLGRFTGISKEEGSLPGRG